ncbi:MAG: FkbM family methyltransferase [Paracoccaceae bacterium]
MTDYGKAIHRSQLKRVAIWLLEKPWINAPVVGVLRNFKGFVWRQRLPVMRGVGQIALPGGATVDMLSPARCNIAREIWWNDGKLADAADRNALELAIALSKDADMFLDIGSYTGLFAMAVARCNPCVRCHAFEIVPDNFLLLWQNVIHNNLIKRVEVMFKGAAEFTGSIHLPVRLEAGVLPSSIALDSDSPDGIEVPVESIDLMIDAREGKVVIKIDVEGFEWSVLKGARGLLESTRPDIICEFLTRAPDIPAIVGYLNSLGYAFYRITGEGLVHSDAIVPVRSERDWLLTGRSRAEIAQMGWKVL